MTYPLVSIWPTTGCNLHCIYCFYDPSVAWPKQVDMSFETADTIIRIINSGDVEAIAFFGGEPLVNWPIVKYILEQSRLEEIWPKRKKSLYNITTNGVAMTPEMMDVLRKKKVHISLSFDGMKTTQDHWRGNSYDTILKNLDLYLKYPRFQILKTMATPATLYDDVKHIKDLGFPGLFINMLDPFSHFTYEGCDVEDFKYQYKRVVTELMDDKFRVGDYTGWKRLIDRAHQGNMRSGCGFINRGLGIGADGLVYPCHQGPCNASLAIGDIWRGIDVKREKKLRDVKRAPTCARCVYHFNKCPRTMYNKYGRFGKDAPDWYRKFELAKIRVIEDLNNMPYLEAACEKKSWFKRTKEK